jgi:hypothetical protein
MPRTLRLRSEFAIPAVALGLLGLARCGGGGDSTTGPPPSGEVASVTVVPQSVTLYAGEERQLVAVARDQAGNALAGRSVSWSTTAPAVATVSTTGLVAGVGAGSATITATSEGQSGSAAVTVMAVASFVSVTAGGAHTCALTASGAAWCWGRGESGQLGVPPPSSTCPFEGGPLPCIGIPVEVGGGHTFVQLAGGGAHTCGLTSDGSAFCWGTTPTVSWATIRLRPGTARFPLDRVSGLQASMRAHRTPAGSRATALPTAGAATTGGSSVTVRPACGWSRRRSLGT